jgi:predicted amidohydrolase YtcJ
MTIPIDRIAQTESVLTMLAGRVVYAAKPYESR